MNEVDNQSFLNSQELSMVFEIVAEKFLPHFEGEKDIWDKLRMMKLPYTLDNVMKNVIVWGSMTVILIPLKKRNSCISGSFTVPKAE